MKLLLTEMARLRITYQDVEDKGGIKRCALKAWRHKNRPNLDSIESALAVVGYTLVPIPEESILTSEIAAALKPIADKLRLAMPEVIAFMTCQALRDHHNDSIAKTDTPEKFKGFDSV